MPVALGKKMAYTPCDFYSKENCIIYTPVTPRRKLDQFGRDTTNQANFFLSAAVYPTGVRAPPLADIQQKCGPISRVDPRTGNCWKKDKQVDVANSWTGEGPKILSLRKQKKGNKVQNHSSVDHDSNVDILSKLPQYHWSTWVDQTKLKQSRSDIRDPLYLNTYCPEERPLRYKETHFPRISRVRPWTVGESNPSKRFVIVDRDARNSNDITTTSNSEQMSSRRIKQYKSYGASFASVNEASFEVKRLHTKEQRNLVKSYDGCLFSQVKQCIRLVKNHDPRKWKKIERPMKAETGRYRPFSTTVIRTPCLSPTPVPMLKDQDSANTYKIYVQTKALQSKLPGSKSAGKLSNGLLARNNTAASHYYDVDSQLVQSVMESNMPDTHGTISSSEGNMSEREEILTFTSAKRNRKPRDFELDVVGKTIYSVRDESRNTSGKSFPSEKGSRNSEFQSTLFLTERNDLHEPEPNPIPLDESGNPTIWDKQPDNNHCLDCEKSHQEKVIKVPAGWSQAHLNDDDDEAFSESVGMSTEEKAC